MLVSREQRAPAADLVAAFVSSRQAACTSGSEREQLVRLLVDLVQQLYSRAPPSPELESVPAPESGREFREQSLASSEEGSVADAQVADIGTAICFMLLQFEYKFLFLFQVGVELINYDLLVMVLPCASHKISCFKVMRSCTSLFERFHLENEL